MIELENLLRECAEVHRLLLKHELHHLMRSAAAGTLKFGAAAEGGQVDQMSVAPLILEIRLSTRPGDEGVEQIVRLYFTEPDHAPRCLLAAKVAGKRPGPLGWWSKAHTLGKPRRGSTGSSRTRRESLKLV